MKNPGIKPFSFGKDVCQDPRKSFSKEWLLTNGLGGYASSTIAGANTRSYHGLLTASLLPPVRRYVILSGLDEAIAIEDRVNPISTQLYAGPTVTEGYKRILSFRSDPYPTWRFENEDVVLEKTIIMPHGENGVFISYHLLRSEGLFRLIVKPLLAYRPIHQLGRENGKLSSSLDTERGSIRFAPYTDLPPVYFKHDSAILDKSGRWYKNFDYPVERRRGLGCEEDLYNPFTLIYSLGEKKRAFLYVSLHPAEKVTFEALLKKGSERTSDLIPAKIEEGRSDLGYLHLAADQFLVRHARAVGGGSASGADGAHGIIAGYPWFNEWGRDTMIAFHGLTLTTGRYDLAKEILLGAKDTIQQGMLPECFREEDGKPAFTSVDASLWFVNACFRYLEYTEDYNTIEKHLYPKICQIIKLYHRGIEPYLSVDKDGLIQAGSPKEPMTWMDVKLGGEAITSRHGKAVEVNALWHNALCIAEFFADYFKLEEDKAFFSKLAREVHISFNKIFWAKELNYLYDVVYKDRQDTSFRPNQLIAMALPFHILEESDVKWKSILDKVDQELLTPYGLRSLSPRDKEYRGTYEGDQKRRDLAYHQGTVWPWFLGFYVTAYFKLHGVSKTAKKQIKNLLDDFLKKHLEEACLGTVSEIFDGDSPHHPRGCFAQAWSVSELLRAYEELGEHLFEQAERAEHFTLR